MGEKQKRTEKIWEDKIKRYYVYQSTPPHRIYKELITVLMLRIVIVNYVHCYINNNNHNHFDGKIISDIVLITVLFSPLIIQMFQHPEL